MILASVKGDLLNFLSGGFLVMAFEQWHFGRFGAALLVLVSIGCWVLGHWGPAAPEGTGS